MRARGTSRVAGVWLGALALTSLACGGPAVRGEAENGRAAAESDEAPPEDGASMETAHDPPSGSIDEAERASPDRATSEQATSEQAEQATSDSAASDPATSVEPDPGGPPTPLDLSCGRARTEVPGDWAVVLDDSQPCSNPGYPMEMEAEGVAGASSRFSLRGHGCELELSLHERTSDDPEAASETTVAADDRGAHANAATPEGTRLELRIAGHDHPPGCIARAAPLLRSLLDALTVRALRDAAVEAHVDVTSAGHGLRVPLPEGWWLRSLGGAADQWETGYQLHGPGDAFATIYTAWDPEVEPVEGTPRQNPVFLSPRATWTDEYEPGFGWWSNPEAEDEAEGQCRHTYASPELRIVTQIYVCGPRAERRRVLRRLRAARFTPPPAEGR